MWNMNIIQWLLSDMYMYIYIHMPPVIRCVYIPMYTQYEVLYLPYILCVLCVYM